MRCARRRAHFLRNRFAFLGCASKARAQVGAPWPAAAQAALTAAMVRCLRAHGRTGAAIHVQWHACVTMHNPFAPMGHSSKLVVQVRPPWPAAAQAATLRCLHAHVETAAAAPYGVLSEAWAALATHRLNSQAALRDEMLDASLSWVTSSPSERRRPRAMWKEASLWLTLAQLRISGAGPIFQSLHNRTSDLSTRAIARVVLLPTRACDGGCER